MPQITFSAFIRPQFDSSLVSGNSSRSLRFFLRVEHHLILAFFVHRAYYVLLIVKKKENNGTYF